MRNVDFQVQGDKLVITIDTGKTAREAAEPSSTGKTHLLATSGGYTLRHKDVAVMLNATIPAPVAKA